MDPVSAVFSAIGGALKLYDQLSEADKEKVRAGLRASRVQTHQEVAGLQGDVAALKAEHQELQEQIAAAREQHAEAKKLPMERAIEKSLALMSTPDDDPSSER